MNFKLTVEGSRSRGSSVRRSTLEQLLHHPYSLYFACCFSGDAALQRFLPALCGKHSPRTQSHARDSAPTSPAGAADPEVCTAFPPILAPVPALSCQACSPPSCPGTATLPLESRHLLSAHPICAVPPTSGD